MSVKQSFFEKFAEGIANHSSKIVLLAIGAIITWFVNPTIPPFLNDLSQVSNLSLIRLLAFFLFVIILLFATCLYLYTSTSANPRWRLTFVEKGGFYKDKQGGKYCGVCMEQGRGRNRLKFNEENLFQCLNCGTEFSEHKKLVKPATF